MNSTKELYLYDKSFNYLIGGCDEAGRGSLAGPVVCACCVMPLENDAPYSKMIEGINDSKRIPEKKREILYEKIIETAIAYSVSVIDCTTIDEINILQATRLGMSNAINEIKNPPKLILVDAVSKLNVKVNYKPIIKGDSLSYNIAAASILAKVTRDRLLRELDKEFPQYGFFQNKGYATKGHIEALRKNGACAIHRKLFIRNALSKQLSFEI